MYPLRMKQHTGVWVALNASENVVEALRTEPAPEAARACALALGRIAGCRHMDVEALIEVVRKSYAVARMPT